MYNGYKYETNKNSKVLLKRGRLLLINTRFAEKTIDANIYHAPVHNSG